MIIRRIALNAVLAGVAASAILVGLARSQQPPSTQQAPPSTQQTGPSQLTAPGGTRNPPITDQRIIAPPSSPPSSERDSLLDSLDCYKPTKPSILELHCNATVALVEFIYPLGPFLGPFGSTNPISNCDAGMIDAINKINLKVNTAIDFHKFSDRIFDDPRYEQRKLSVTEKSRRTTENDIKIRIISDILTPYIVKHGSQLSDFAPLVYHRDLVRYAGEILFYNNELSRWGVDAGFLTAARGFAIYQFVFNCVRTHDFRLLSTLMAARAYAVRTAAESESWISREIENLQRERVARPALRRWLVENDLIAGGVQKGGGFPQRIYLGSNHSFEYWLQAAPQEIRCPPGQVRNYYGRLNPKTKTEGPYTYIVSFDSAGVEDQCDNEINQRGFPAINTLLTNRTLPYVPQGGAQKADYEILLGNIAIAITEHIKRITQEKDHEACDYNPNYSPSSGGTCVDLANLFGRRDAVISAEVAREREQIVAELRALQRMALAIRNILSTGPIFEDRRSLR